MSESNITCPFCGDTDFDISGLKTHLSKGSCDTFEETELHHSPFDGLAHEVRAIKVTDLQAALATTQRELEDVKVRCIDLDNNLAEMTRRFEVEFQTCRSRNAQVASLTSQLGQALAQRDKFAGDSIELANESYALTAERDKAMSERNEAVSAPDELLNTSAVITRNNAANKDDFVDLQVQSEAYETAYNLLQKHNQ